MINNIFKRLLFLFFVLLLIGCTNKVMVFDTSLPDEETVIIYWVGTESSVHPVTYNGISVDWNIGSWGFYPLKLPAGNSVFELDGYTQSGSVDAITGSSFSIRYNWRGLHFSYFFEKGQEYTVHFQGRRMSIHRGKSGSKNTLIYEYLPDWTSPDRWK